MTYRQGTQERDACGADAAAYALGALTPAQAAAFEAHLASCGSCRDELASFQHVVDAMPLAVERRRAPRRIRRRVLRIVDQEARAARPGTTGAPAPRRSVGMRTAVLAAGLLVAAVLAFAGVEVAGSSSSTHVYQAQVVGQGSGDVTLTGAQAELVVRRFAAPPRGHVYEVWVKRSGKPPIPANALFDVTAAGNRAVRLPVQVRRGDQILVTAEPAGGTSAPTTTPVLSARLG